MDDRIKNLVFDFGGVLIDIDIERCVNAFRALGFAAEPLVGKYQQQGVFRDFELGNISSEVFCQSVRHDAGKPVSDEQIVRAWKAMLVSIARPKLDKLLELRNRYKVYLLSNTNVLHWKASLPMFAQGGHRVSDYFDDIFLSFEMHVCKPDARIFQSLVCRAGIFPHETMLIDDSAANCEAARLQGWQTLRVEAGTDWISSL